MYILFVKTYIQRVVFVYTLCYYEYTIVDWEVLILSNVKEVSKPRSFRFTDKQLELIDELVDIENDRRMTVAREMNLEYKSLNRTSLLLYLVEEKKRKYQALGEI